MHSFPPNQQKVVLRSPCAHMAACLLKSSGQTWSDRLTAVPAAFCGSNVMLNRPARRFVQAGDFVAVTPVLGLELWTKTGMYHAHGPKQPPFAGSISLPSYPKSNSGYKPSCIVNGQVTLFLRSFPVAKSLSSGREPATVSCSSILRPSEDMDLCFVTHFVPFFPGTSARVDLLARDLLFSQLGE